MTQIDALPLALLSRDACNALKAAVSHDEDRPTLNNVLIRDRWAEATNGHVIVRIPLRGADGEEFAPPDELRGVRYLIHRSALAHVKSGTALEVDMTNGECRVIPLKDEKEGYPIELPDAELELEGAKYPDLDDVWPDATPAHRRVRLAAPILKALTAFAGTGKYAGSLELLIPEHSEGSDHVDSGIPYVRRGEQARSGVVMPMKIDPADELTDSEPDEDPADPNQIEMDEVGEDDDLDEEPRSDDGRQSEVH